MPSPFPGMDPFLEHAAFFHPMHQRLAFCISEAIQPRLPEPYDAEIEDRTWIEVSNRPVEPDVNVLRAELPTRRSNGGVAVADATLTAPVVVRVPHLERHETYLNIYARFEDREQIVTTIEILSPTNKTPSEKGRELYLQKQQEVLDGRTHLVEIDLLRGGQHTTAVPVDYLRVAIPAYDYHVCIKQFDNVEDYLIYPIQLHDKLPTVAVPLLPGDGFIPLDVQAVFDRAYDTGPYRRRVRYTDPVPAPALTPEKAAWVETVLREQGLLPSTLPPAGPGDSRT